MTFPPEPAPCRTPCDRCGALAVFPLFDNPDYLSGEVFRVVRCANCGLARTACPPEDAAMGQYYGAAYYGEKGRRFLPLMEWAVGRFRDARARAVRRFHRGDRPGAVLDVGCGRGLMLIGLKRQGWRCAGTERSEELAALLGAEYDIPIYTDPHLYESHLTPESFDVITLWHSLEHMRHPAKTIAEVARLLKPGGVVIVEVPNLASWQARIGRGRWFHLDTPRHLYHFSAETLRDVLAEHGLQPVGESTLSWEQGFYGMWQTLLNRVTTEPNVLYTLLKKKRPRSRGPALAWNLGITALLLLPAAVLGTIAEALAVIFRRGGVIRIVARKTTAE